MQTQNDIRLKHLIKESNKLLEWHGEAWRAECNVPEASSCYWNMGFGKGYISARHDILPNVNDKIELSAADYHLIQSFDKFDLEMLLSEVSDFGWPSGERLLPAIKNAMIAEKKKRRRR